MAYLYVNFYNDNNNFKLVFYFKPNIRYFKLRKWEQKIEGEREERKHARNVKLKLRKAEMDGNARVEIYIL